MPKSNWNFPTNSPMVQQYGPLVKSLPAIVKMMKSNGSSDEEKVKI
ncbi:hypothetical protein KHA80_03545 [Anaerobacillus sp. HL2]|nr:hypothetical protein KHA80_03545 [Anaerobacillus sp. HL2]